MFLTGDGFSLKTEGSEPDSDTILYNLWTWSLCGSRISGGGPFLGVQGARRILTFSLKIRVFYDLL